MVFMAQTSHERTYRGVQGAKRQAARRGLLLNAGLDLLGAGRQDVAELTVRGICGRAGLTARYFYESFRDKEEFVGAVFDWVVGDLAATTQAAVATAPGPEQTRAGVANLVRTIADDARIGRLLFSTELAHSTVLRRRAELTVVFAMLSGQHVGNVLQVPANDRIDAAAHFVVGGVGQTISAWLAGHVRLREHQLVDQLASLLEQLANPDLYRVTETEAAAKAASSDP